MSEAPDGSEDGFEGFELLVAASMKRILDLRETYRAALPNVVLTCSPFTGEQISYPIDVLGLDGLWWDYEHPVRRDEPTAPGLLALTGAVTLGRKAPYAPFVCRPGPEVPYVIPSMLEHPEVRAVLSHMRIGRLTAYAITYFVLNPRVEVRRWNTWGSDSYGVAGTDGSSYWGTRYEAVTELDFELAPWIESEKLMWVKPGDPPGALRSDLEGCPYLDLPGRRQLLTIYRGRLWN